MLKYPSKFLSSTLLLLALPLAGCATDRMFADESITPYGGSKLHPIKVANGKAVVDNCGDWSEDRADSSGNEMAASHGCAVQSNIAAMAAYPQDLLHGRKPPKGLGWTHQSSLKNLTDSAAASGGSSGGSSSSGTPAISP